MRNAVVARDPVAADAARRTLAEEGTAADMALAAALASATRGSSTGLLGGIGLMVVGPGVGAHFVDGRPRAPGVGEKRPKVPDETPGGWTAAVPGFLPGVIAAQTRFGTLDLAALVRLARDAIRESSPDPATRARVEILTSVGRHGMGVMKREGLRHAMLSALGPVVRGTFTDDDFNPAGIPITPMVACVDGQQEVYVPPRAPWRTGAHRPPPLPEVFVESVVAADRHGVMAAACWPVAPEAVPLEGVPLSLPSLLPPWKKGVARWRPGRPLPVALPMAVLCEAGRCWGAVAVSGEGQLVEARDAAVNARLASGGVSLSLGDASLPPAVLRRAVLTWLQRELTGDKVFESVTAL